MYQVNEPLVVHDTIDGEVLVIRNDTGAYYSMVGPAADVWAGVRGGLDIPSMVDMLAGRYDADPDELDGAVTSFLAELLEAQLVRPGTAGSEVELPEPFAERVQFEVPRLEVYTDMADLLLFDPIHEVTPDGWPNVVDGRT